MFVGHFAIAFGAKRAVPAVSLGTLFIAAQLADLVWPVLAIYAANLFGPPPPSGMAAAWSALAMWLLVAWGYWVDRHRAAVRV